MNDFNQINDENILLLLKRGNEMAFTEIYNRYWDKLYYIAHKLLKNTEAAEEIVQEVFLMLWQKREKLNIQSIQSYLAAMTRYAVFHYITNEKRYREKEKSIGLSNEFATAEFNMDDKILLDIIEELSNKLPEKCRLVFQYNKLQDKSMADVAAQLNITQKTAEAHLTKALRVIRANFKQVINISIGLLFEFLIK